MLIRLCRSIWVRINTSEKVWLTIKKLWTSHFWGVKYSHLAAACTLSLPFLRHKAHPPSPSWSLLFPTPTSNAQPFCFLIYCLKLKALAEFITKVFSSHRVCDPNLNQYAERNRVVWAVLTRHLCTKYVLNCILSYH